MVLDHAEGQAPVLKFSLSTVTALVEEETPFKKVLLPLQIATLLPALGVDGNGLTLNTVVLVPVAKALETVIYPVVADTGNVVVIVVSLTTV
jgi:hypothetical protein